MARRQPTRFAYPRVSFHRTVFDIQPTPPLPTPEPILPLLPSFFSELCVSSLLQCGEKRINLCAISFYSHSKQEARIVSFAVRSFSLRGKDENEIKINRVESFYQLIHGVKLESDRFGVGLTFLRRSLFLYRTIRPALTYVKLEDGSGSGRRR